MKRALRNILLLSIGLLYFEFRKEAMWLTILFLATNLAATLVTLRLGLPFYGYGYLTACFVALLTGVLVMDRKITHLEYITFVQQPVH